MTGIRLPKASSCLALAALLLMTSCSCSETLNRDEAPAAGAQPAGAEPSQALAPVPPNARASAERGSKTAFESDVRGRLGGIELTPEQKQELDELYREREQWQAERDELERLDGLPPEERDRDARESSRRRLEELRRNAPDDHDFLAKLTAEQREQVAQNGEPPEPSPFRDPLDDPNITDEQRQEIEQLPRSRRAWQVKHRLELDGLREQVEEARVAGDTAGQWEAQSKLDALTATRPSAKKIIEEASEESSE
jgi:hypothetical protein